MDLEISTYEYTVLGERLQTPNEVLHRTSSFIETLEDFMTKHEINGVRSYSTPGLRHR